MRPLVRSYGVISTRTLSPASTRMRFLRMRPAVWAMISCSFSSLTRNVAFGSSSVTTPGNSSSSSFAIDIRVRVPRAPYRLPSFNVLGVREWPRKLAETAGFHNHCPRESLVAPGPPTEPRLDALDELVADLAIGVELLLAAAVDDGGIGGGPIFHLDGQRAGELERAVMRLRRQRHDQVEIESFPILELLERHRSMLVDIEPDLVDHRDCERIELALAHAGGADVRAAAEHLPKQRRRHRRADRIQAAKEQHRMRLERAPGRGHPITPSNAGRRPG